MKKEYKNPEIIITSFEAKDIITLSSVNYTKIGTTYDFDTYLHS